MTSFQQRTDDLYRLKVRNLVYQKVDGTYPGKGTVAYTTDTVGSVGWSPITLDSSGNLTVPGTTTLGFNGSVVVDGQTGILTANRDVNVAGIVTAATVSTNAINMTNTTNPLVKSQIVDASYNGLETLLWTNNANQSEPLSGWTAKLALDAHIFRTVNTTDLSGVTLVLAQNMNYLLALFQSRVCFVNTLTSNAIFAAVFNSTVGVRFTVSPLSGASKECDVIQTGSLTQAVTYSTLASTITNTWNSTNPSLTGALTSTYNASTGIFDISAAAGYTFRYSDISTNGTGQLYFNHIGLSWIPTVSATRISTTITGDLAVQSPPIPATPTRVVGTVYDVSATITVPQPVSPLVPVLNACIYWCISGANFSAYPNAIVSIGTPTYIIRGLVQNTNYNVAISYRSAYDESPRSGILTFKTQPNSSFAPYFQGSGNLVFSVDITQDANWLATPSYGISNVNYNKPYANNVKFTVATVFSAIYTGTLSDLTNINQIQSVQLAFYAGVDGIPTDARFFVGGNPQQNVIYAPDSDTVESQYGDANGVGGSMLIYPDTDGIDMLGEIFNADSDGAIDIGKNIVFGWYSSRAGSLRNCELTEFTVLYNA